MTVSQLGQLQNKLKTVLQYYRVQPIRHDLGLSWLLRL